MRIYCFIYQVLHRYSARSQILAMIQHMKQVLSGSSKLWLARVGPAYSVVTTKVLVLIGLKFLVRWHSQSMILDTA
jgi:hypothetical protein